MKIKKMEISHRRPKKKLVYVFAGKAGEMTAKLRRVTGAKK